MDPCAIGGRSNRLIVHDDHHTIRADLGIQLDAICAHILLPTGRQRSGISGRIAGATVGKNLKGPAGIVPGLAFIIPQKIRLPGLTSNATLPAQPTGKRYPGSDRTNHVDAMPSICDPLKNVPFLPSGKPAPGRVTTFYRLRPS